MKRVLAGCLFPLLLAAGARGSGLGNGLRIAFWNVENFFDTHNDSTSVSDAEFSAFGERHWTRKRFTAKCNGIAKTLLWADLPDAVGLAEVENGRVLRRLLQETPLIKTDYRAVHFDSPDPRGIDVALLYRKGRLLLLEARPFHVYLPPAAQTVAEATPASGPPADSLLRTRDILYARLQDRATGETFSLLVCHLPSKYGGAAASVPRRAAAVRRLRMLADSLPPPLVVIGDFNDTPDSPVFVPLEEKLVNLSVPLFKKGEGSLRYAGKWDLIDQIWVSPDLSGRAVMTLLKPPFLLTEDRTHGGLKPLRTYVGPRHTAGLSDHLPVSVQIPP